MNKKVVIFISILVVLFGSVGIVIYQLYFALPDFSHDEDWGGEPDPVFPTAENPITFSRETTVTQQNKTSTFKIGIFNPSDELINLIPEYECSGDIKNFIDFPLDEKAIKSNSYILFEQKMNIFEAPKSTYLCQMRIQIDKNNYSKDFVIRIQ